MKLELIISSCTNLQSSEYTSRYSIFMHIKIFYFFFVILFIFSNYFNQFKSKVLFKNSSNNDKRFARKDTKKPLNIGTDLQSLGFSNILRHNNMLNELNWFKQNMVKEKVEHKRSAKKEVNLSNGNSN